MSLLILVAETTKANEDQERKQCYYESKKKRNNDSNLSSKQKERKEIFYKLFKERFKELIQWTGKTNFNDLIKYHKGMSRKRFDDFNDPIKLWKKNRRSQYEPKRSKKWSKWVWMKSK